MLTITEIYSLKFAENKDSACFCGKNSVIVNTLGVFMYFHFIGICGCSMSGIAKLLRAQGHTVTGSDLKSCEISEIVQSVKCKVQNNSAKLKNKNIQIYHGHKPGNITKDIDEVIYTVAVDNERAQGYVELKQAREIGIKCTSRAKFIGRFMNDKIGIAVSGMHGKTTVTTMISLILEKAGYNPTCLVGSEVKEWKLNVRVGGSRCHREDSDDKVGGRGNFIKDDKDYFANTRNNRGFKFGKLNEYVVVEACEYQKQMLDFRPKIVVITNLEAEHLDTYKKGMKDIRQAFKKFIRLLPSNGLLVVWQEDKNLMSLTKAAKCKVKRVSINKPWPGLKLKVLGKHNLLDATFAARVCHELGVPHKIIKKVLNDFTGAARRFEIKGEKNGVTVIDDYGHHPTEIKNTIQAAREFLNKFQISDLRFKNEKKFKIINHKSAIENRLIMVFQPHQQQRTKLLFNDFVKCFDGIDKLIITDVYLIAGREKSTGENLAKKLVEEIKKRGVSVKYIDNSNDYQKIIDYLKTNTKKGDLVITQGATDIYKVGEEFLR